MRIASVRRLMAVGILTSLALVLAACSGNDGGGADPIEQSDVDAAEESDGSESGPTDAGEVVEVVGGDYFFDGVPNTVAVGTRFTFTNESEVELHELVIAPLAAGDDRPVEELLALGPALQEELAGPPSVLIAAPGEQGTAVAEEGLGDGTVTAPGRYLLLCFIPQGIDPAEYVGPEGEYDTPPHAALGMVGEITVTT